MKCNICNITEIEPVYRRTKGSNSKYSRLLVWYCPRCRLLNDFNTNRMPVDLAG